MLLFSLALLAVPQGQVHVVDAAGGPGADFTELAPAVSAAVEGDVVLVRTGDYFDDGLGTDGVYLDGRGVVVVADSGAVVRTSLAQIRNLPATSHVLLQGLTFTSMEILGDLDDNAGATWFERCSFQPQFALTAGGLLPNSCDTIVLARCDLTAVPSIVPTTTMLTQDARIFAFDSTFQGFANQGLFAAAELRQGSFLQLFGSTILGGDGIPGSSPLTCDGGDGGDALSLEQGSTLVRLDSAIDGGVGGAPFNGGCVAGQDGEDILNSASTVIALAGTARSMDVVSPVRTDEMVQVTFTGLPGDTVWLRYALVAGAGQASHFFDGEYLLGTPRFKALTTTLPASGTLVFTTPAPQLQPGQESLVVYCQAFFRASGGGRFALSSPSAAVLLDSSF